MSSDGLVGVVSRLDVRGIVVRFPTGTRVLSLFQSTQTDSGGHPAFHSMDPREREREGGGSSRVNWSGREFHNCPPSSSNVRSEWLCNLTPHYSGHPYVKTLYYPTDAQIYDSLIQLELL